MATYALDARQAEQLRTYIELVRTSPHNLVSARARNELWSRHVPECLALANLLRDRSGPLLDVGSGGGLPGMILAIADPGREVHLLDATAKKTGFLAAVRDALDLEVTVHTGRAEEVSRGTLAGHFETVTARAVAPLTRLIPLAVPFLRDRGVLAAVKGERWRSELAEAAGQLRTHRVEALATPETLVVPTAGDGPLRVVMIGRQGTPLLLPALPPVPPTT